MQPKVKSILHRLNRRDLPLFPKFRINKYFKITLILFVVFSAVFVTKTILAQTTTATTTEETINTKISAESIQEFQDKQNAMEEGNNQESWMKESVGSNAMVGVNVLAGTIPASVLEGKTTSWVPGGLIGLTSKSIASLYNIPVSGVEYLAYVKDNFLGKSTYAAGGYEGLSPLIPIWKGFRNVTYVLFSIVFVVIGIMIMLRVKISPQAVITIQSAIPKLITSLILVTFSYAIVGLLIDFSYVISGLGISIVSKAGGFNYDVIKTLEHPAVLGKMFGLVPFGAIAIIFGVITAILTAFAGIAGLIGGGLLLVIALLILTIVIVVQTIKFFIGLIKCYLTILLKTIIAPLEIAIGAIPNMKMGFNTWFLDVFANLMVFPITLIFLVAAEIITTTIRKSASSGAFGWITGNSPLWTPPQLAWLLSGGDIVAIAIGIGALTLVAKLPKLIPEFIFQIKPSPYGKAIGDSLGAGWNAFAKSDPVKGAVGYGKSKFMETAGSKIKDVGDYINTNAKNQKMKDFGDTISKGGTHIHDAGEAGADFKYTAERILK